MKWLWELIQGYKNKDMVPPKKEDLVAAVEKSTLKLDMPEKSANWKGIVWHHSASDDHPDLDNWSSIKNYHIAWRHDGNIVSERKWRKIKRTGENGNFQRPWSDIGYHAGVEREKGKLVWRLGRSWEKAGAHAGFKGDNTFNEKYLGLCAVGNFDKDTPDPELWEFCQSVTKALMDQFGIPISEVIGHREVYDRVGKPRAKTCPGSNWDMDKFRDGL